MNFTINQYKDYIDIFAQGKLFIKVQRRSNFWHKKILDFYLDTTLVLTAVDSDSLFSKKWSITFQSFEEILDFRKSKTTFNLFYNEFLVSVKGYVYRNPLYSIYINAKEVGVVTSQTTTFESYPIVYDVVFDGTQQEAIYCFVLLVMHLPYSIEE